MAEKKVTMVMKVDLGCYRCYKKIKKVICKFPEIRDQEYDEKQNKVKITVISCCPKRILEKIARKGGKTVESIEIVPEKKPDKKEDEKPKEAKKEGDKPKEAEKKKDAPARKNGGQDNKDGEEKKVVESNKHIYEPVSAYSTIYPSGMYYQPPQTYYQGYGAMPYYHRVPAYYNDSSYGVNRGYNTNHADYFSEENPESCRAM